MTKGLFETYLEGGAADLFAGHPLRAEDRLAAVRRAERPLRPSVAAALRAQSAALPADESREAALSRLQEGASAVVTGQQAGLFLGPLYTVFKAATAIRVARLLSQESGRPVVPVFWLQSEDHDLPEIAAVTEPGPPGGEPVELRLPVPPGSRVSVRHVPLPPEVEGQVAALERALVPLPHAAAHVNLISRYYYPGRGWVDAFAGVLAELFEGLGLVIADPRDEALGPEAATVHRESVLRADEISRALQRRAADLRSRGFDAPVHVRDGSPLSFFHPAGAEGPRHRLEPAGSGFAAAGDASCGVSREELLELLDREPLRFSTSALLRPVLQDTLLPTAAYVGGPGEVAYLAQVPPLHEAFGLPFPLVWPRARFRVVDPATRRLLQRLGLRASDAAAPEDELLRRCRPVRAAGDAGLLDEMLQPLQSRGASLAASGPGMDRAVAKAEEAVRDAVRKLAAKHEKALLHEDERLVADVRRVRQALNPGGVPHERVHGVASHAAREGGHQFVRRVVDAVVPLDFAVKDLE